MSMQTTANLNKRWFWQGYYAHAWGSHRNYYSTKGTYSFIDKIYMPWEYPKRTLMIESSYDLASPSDRYLPTDKDNMFVAFKWADVNKMTLCNRQQIAFEYEMYGGLKTSLSLKAEEHEAVGAMSFSLKWNIQVLSVIASFFVPPSSLPKCAMLPMRPISTVSSAVSPSIRTLQPFPLPIPSASRTS